MAASAMEVSTLVICALVLFMFCVIIGIVVHTKNRLTHTMSSLTGRPQRREPTLIYPQGENVFSNI